MPSTLVLVLCLYGLKTFGSGLDPIFKGLKEDMTSSIRTAERQTDIAVTAPKLTEPLPHTNPSAENPQPEPERLPAVKPIVAPAETGRLVVTIGANGATEFLASRLIRQIDQWRHEGKITETDANLLIRLANTGYQMAKDQEEVEQFVNQGFGGLESKTQLAPAQFTKIFFGYSAGATKQDMLSLNPEVANTSLKPFAQAYHQALQSGALRDPSLKQEVTEMALQIAGVSNALRDSAPLLLQWQQEELYTKSQVRDLRKLITVNFEKAMSGLPFQAPKDTDNLTRRDSGTICNRGSGKADGTVCRLR